MGFPMPRTANSKRYQEHLLWQIAPQHHSWFRKPLTTRQHLRFDDGQVVKADKSLRKHSRCLNIALASPSLMPGLWSLVPIGKEVSQIRQVSKNIAANGIVSKTHGWAHHIRRNPSNFDFFRKVSLRIPNSNSVTSILSTHLMLCALIVTDTTTGHLTQATLSHAFVKHQPLNSLHLLSNAYESISFVSEVPWR